MNGYEIVEKYFKEWIETQSYLNNFYVAIFQAKRATISFEQFEYFFEPFEYDFNGDDSIIWQYDWCEGENEIIDLRFYSLDDIKYIIIDAENHQLNNTNRKWFNAWRWNNEKK